MSLYILGNVGILAVAKTYCSCTVNANNIAVMQKPLDCICRIDDKGSRLTLGLAQALPLVTPYD